MGRTHTPLTAVLLGPILERYFSPETIAFATGSGGTLLSNVVGLASCWSMFFVAIVGFYHTVAPLIVRRYERMYPDAPTSKVTAPLIKNMIEVSRRAFPMYVTVPVLCDFFRQKGWAMSCDSLEECGGWGASILACFAYFASLEIIIFIDHYYLLHKLDIGKRLGEHAYHHVYKYADQLNAFSGYSFAPQDGWSQGMALALCTLFVPVPVVFVYAMEILTGLWTLYIHTDLHPLPWPLMGCDYHYIHHRYNWYNFGFMTVTMDTLFRTVKHPKPSALALSHGALPMPEFELKKSAALTEQILAKRGAEALAADDVAAPKSEKHD